MPPAIARAAEGIVRGRLGWIWLGALALVAALEAACVWKLASRPKEVLYVPDIDVVRPLEPRMIKEPL